MRFRVDGVFADRPATSYLVHADSADAARRTAEAAGVTVAAVAPVEEEPLPNSPVAGAESAHRSASGAGVGWTGLGLGLLTWVLAANAPSTRRVTWEWAEARLYEAVLFGAIGAVAVGLGVWSARRERARWVGLAAAGAAAVLVARSIAELARWL